MARNDRLSLADDIVVNDGELGHLYAQLQVLHEKYLKLSLR
jgi:dephospho-CoA kinase